jgi:hypothetical protein
MLDQPLHAPKENYAFGGIYEIGISVPTIFLS